MSDAYRSKPPTPGPEPEARSPQLHVFKFPHREHGPFRIVVKMELHPHSRAWLYDGTLERCHKDATSTDSWREVKEISQDMVDGFAIFALDGRTPKALTREEKTDIAIQVVKTLSAELPHWHYLSPSDTVTDAIAVLDRLGLLKRSS